MKWCWLSCISPPSKTILDCECGKDWTGGVLDILHEKRYSITLKSRTKSETITEQAVKIFQKVAGNSWTQMNADYQD
jgi:hypothetical protein